MFFISFIFKEEFQCLLRNHFVLETQAIHAGQQLDPTTLSRAVPIYQTRSFGFKDREHAATLFNLTEAGHLHLEL